MAGGSPSISEILLQIAQNNPDDIRCFKKLFFPNGPQRAIQKDVPATRPYCRLKVFRESCSF